MTLAEAAAAFKKAMEKLAESRKKTEDHENAAAVLYRAQVDAEHEFEKAKMDLLQVACGEETDG